MNSCETDGVPRRAHLHGVVQVAAVLQSLKIARLSQFLTCRIPMEWLLAPHINPGYPTIVSLVCVWRGS